MDPVGERVDTFPRQAVGAISVSEIRELRNHLKTHSTFGVLPFQGARSCGCKLSFVESYVESAT